MQLPSGQYKIASYQCKSSQQFLVNIGTVYGFLPDSTKPSPEPMLIYHQ